MQQVSELCTLNAWNKIDNVEILNWESEKIVHEGQIGPFCGADLFSPGRMLDAPGFFPYHMFQYMGKDDLIRY